MNAMGDCMANRDVDIQARAATWFGEYRQQVFQRTDRLFAWLLVWQWVAGIVLALWVAPRTWVGADQAMERLIWAAVVLNGLMIAWPVALAWFRPGRLETRLSIAAVQMLTSGVFIHLTGGRVETHFHVFASLAFLACYRDWRVLIAATVVVFADHVARGFWWPESIYGIAAASAWRPLEQATWVLFEDAFLIAACVQATREMWEMAEQRAQLEVTNARTEQMVVDRTSQLRASQQELVMAKESADAIHQARSEYMAKLSHELRNPMTAILGYADLMLEEGADVDQHLDAVRTIQRNGMQLLGILNDLLDLSRIEAGDLTVESVGYSPARIVEEVASSVRDQAYDKGITFHAEFESEIPETVYVDPTRLRQVLVNLVGHAIQFTQQDEVRLICRCIGRETPQLEFDVIDTGVGLTREQQTARFQPVSQGEPSTTRTFGGTGLRLTVCKRLAEILGGGITMVPSASGAGSLFRVRVAVEPSAGTPWIVPAPWTETSLGEAQADDTSPQGVSLEGVRVLLAEDGADNQRLIQLLLTRAGAEVQVVENGDLAVSEALKRAEKGTPFDVILMDMQMPVLDGSAATARLRTKGYGGCIIALTAHAMSSERDQCLVAGCDDFASKPLEPRKLIELISKRCPAVGAPAN